MSAMEWAQFTGILLVIGVFLFLVRRASEKHAGVRDRLEDRDSGPHEVAPEAQEKLDKAKRDRDDDDDARAKPEAKPKPKKPKKRQTQTQTKTKAAEKPDDIGAAVPDPALESVTAPAEPDDESGADAADIAARAAEVAAPADEDLGVDAERLKAGLAKTRGGFVARLGRLFARKKIDQDILDDLEQVLFTADIGPKTADRIFQALKSGLSKDDLGDPEAVWAKIREQSVDILDIKTEPLDFSRHRPFVLLTIGVNGVGKTTTIGKIAAKLQKEGKRVLLGAGDTFRAAAVEQLEIWGQRASAPVVKGKPASDPSSVIFDAIKRAKDEDFDVVICDTAGRLHTKTELMDELKKVGRVCNKALSGAPHETWLVLDSTTGQNAIQQAQMFKQVMDITGIVLTKLDGTAKGGVILGICDEISVPVRYIGIGEGVEDLREFDVEAFVSALYEQQEAAETA